MPNFLSNETILVNAECRCWQEAVKIGVNLLVRQNCVEEKYADAIILNHQILGPYMVIAPGIVLAHARPEEGALKVAISLITFKLPVTFGNTLNDPVKLIITLAATDAKSHLSLLAQLMELLMNELDVQSIMGAKTAEEVLDIVNRYSL
jgi:PTS system ascorbate-specific IIA component